MRRIGGAGDAALDLRVFDAVGQDRERLRWLVARLHLYRVPIDGPAIKPRGSAGFQATKGYTQALKCQGKAQSRRFANPAGRRLLFAAVNQSAQEGAGSENHRAGDEFAAINQLQTGNSAIRNRHIVNLAFDHDEIGCFPHGLLNRGGIELAVGLGAGTAHRRPFAAVQNPKLDTAEVSSAAHQAVHGIDFTDQMAFSETSDRRIAGHRADGRESMSNQCGVGAEARGSRGRLGSGMPTTYNDYVKPAVHRRSRLPAFYRT